MFTETLCHKDAVRNNGWRAQCEYKSPKDHEEPLLNEGAKKEGHCWSTMCRNRGASVSSQFLAQGNKPYLANLTKKCPNKEWWQKMLICTCAYVRKADISNNETDTTEHRHTQVLVWCQHT